ncbi:AraC family transcriptional regulator [Paenibacillus daejeonensis]|uniref:AraC family transcriptional regulator n=1 Tax=Paenibacillus daejeonensis TaxID=135193 RepID=UPI00035E7DE3|nr:AraC family transcriptional regulator [Paenibacillus daejeonensis]
MEPASIPDPPNSDTLHRLAQLIAAYAPADGTHQTAIPGLSLLRASQPSARMESVYKPSLCIVAQGAKTAALAEELHRYDPASFLVTSVELPVVGHIVEAKPESPYLSLKLTFDADMILELVQTSPVQPAPTDPRGIRVSRVSESLLEAVVRLVRLLETPQDVPVLAPLMIREILYRVLQGEQGPWLRSFAIPGSQAQRIAQAIRTINRDFDRPLLVEQLAGSVHMSASAFHKHFKRITRLSPLQYQKTVRLQEARRLMLTEAMQAADAAYRVGYESPSQFSREYVRMYGQSPAQDMRSHR